MLLRKLLQLNTAKSFLMVLLVVSTFFLGNTKAEAASASWGIVREECFGFDSTGVSQVTVTDEFLNSWIIYYPEPLFSTSFGNLTSVELSYYFQQYPTIKLGTPFWYEIPSDYSNGPIYSYIPNSACKDVEGTHYFGATTGKAEDIYTPGEAIVVNIQASAGGGFEAGGWSGLTTSILYNPITAPISCFLFGCDDPPYVRVLASSSGSYIADCHGDGSAGCGGTFYAPAIPGSYNIHLEGCYINCSPVGTADIPFVVLSPAVPNVELNFSFLDKIKTSLGII